MVRADYHLHTYHSMDGMQTFFELCEAALAANLQEICVTEHLEIGHPDPEMDKPPVQAAFREDLEKARASYPQLTIRMGMEIGDHPAHRPEIRRWLDAWPLDFRLLSLHLIHDVDPYDPRYYDAYPDQQHAYRAYLEARLESIQAWDPADYDAIAHLGYVAKFAPYPPAARPLRWEMAPDHLEAMLRIVAQNGKALEINTSGYPRIGEPIPGRQLLEHFRALGGEFVMISSDAHRAASVGAYQEEARALARACGFRYTLLFKDRKPTPITI
ncbi:MAG: histidinol-phosphatase HisJ family protein [Clostridia bacterium]